jgi:predicted transcriptional regulator
MHETQLSLDMQRPLSSTAPSSTVAANRDSRRWIWDGERQAFVAGTLREAMLVRGFTPHSLAVSARVAESTMYNALAGRPTRLRTARRVLETLAGVEPKFELSRLG